MNGFFKKNLGLEVKMPVTLLDILPLIVVTHKLLFLIPAATISGAGRTLELVCCCLKSL